ncbi:hypothetical protein WH47_12457, partial [Habropoda laboriosa]
FGKNSTNMILRALHSPDQAPCDFFPSSKLKLLLRRHRFDSIVTIKRKTIGVRRIDVS